MASGLRALTRWLRALSWPMLKAQAGRQLLALLAIALGVALAYGVQLMNASALAEFGAAQRSLAGTPDLQLRAREGSLDETWLARLGADARVRLAAPVLEGQAQLLLASSRQPLRLLGLDALQTPQLSPALAPQPFAGAAALWDALAPDALYLNPAALQSLPQPYADHVQLRLVRADGSVQTAKLRLAGRIAAAGAPLAVLDIAAAQALFGRVGQLDRIDLRLQDGVAADALQWPPALLASSPADAGAQRGADLAELTRAYRVNLGVLSLMALFTGSFLVFAVLSLSVAQRLPQLALLGVLGMSARARVALLLAEATLLGLLGSALGLALGAGLASLGLRLLGGDLGSGMLGGGTPALRVEAGSLLLYGGLGLAVSLLSMALPALAVRRMAPAQVLKGLGSAGLPRLPAWAGPALLALGAALALLPALDGLALAAYAAMLCLLLGGLACVPALVQGLSRLLPRHTAGQLLLRERARAQAGEAAQLLAGVLVALALSVAMLVMVHSFRESLHEWLRQMLPADLYVRSTLRDSTRQPAALPAEFISAVQGSGLAQDLAPQRTRQAWVGDTPVTLLARRLPADESRLPLSGPLGPAPAAGLLPVYINEALRDQLGVKPGTLLPLSLQSGGTAPPSAFVRGVWRDYSRQSGALLLGLSDYQRWSGDAAITELSLWLAPGRDLLKTEQALRGLAAEPGDLELAATGELLAFSLRLFDRSFAVTYWLQAFALALGLVGVAASLSAQVLARRREFGLLLHLGFTRARLRALLLQEAALFASAGALAGLLLGLAISAVLVWVVNPQSFHWSMDLRLPLPRLGALLVSMLAAVLLTAWASGLRLGRADAVQAVKEDW